MAFVTLSLITLKAVVIHDPFTLKAMLYATLISGTILATATLPIGTELAVEVCYPASEVVVGGWITVW